MQMPDHTQELELALGLKHSLNGLKRRVPAAQDFADLGLDPYSSNFAELLLVEMHRAVRIHFDLAGMAMLNALDGVLQGPKEFNAPGSTNWELRTIWDAPTLKKKT